MTNERLQVLVQQCRKGDRLSQREVYEHFYATVFAVCLRYASSREEAKELTNDAFFKAFTRLEQFEAGGNFGGWLYTIARRTALDRYRVAVMQPHVAGAESLPEGGGPHLENQILNRLDTEEKLRFVQYLPPAYRAVFNLYVVEGYTHEEIATELGISVGASKSNLSKARVKLREMIERYTNKQIQQSTFL
jgi:RNA polymerase sigma factor (sigma-70 family)